MVYGDFDKTNTEALGKLGKSLKSLGAINETRRAGRTSSRVAEGSGSITTRPFQQSAPDDPAVSSQNIIARRGGTLVTGSRPHNIGDISSGDTNDQAQSSAWSIQNHVSGPQKVYFEICVNSREHAVVLSEVDVSSVKFDGELFDKIWSTYNGTRRSWWRKLFAKPCGVHFVYVSLSNLPTDPLLLILSLVGVRHRHQAGIYKKPLEIPPIAEVIAKSYHYHECPLEPLPPMPDNIFLHYLTCARRKSWHCEVPNAHQENHFLQRLPKKVHHSIFHKVITRGGSHISNNSTAFG